MADGVTPIVLRKRDRAGQCIYKQENYQDTANCLVPWVFIADRCSANL